MNCPLHVRETTDPEALKKKSEREETEMIEFLLAGRFVEEDYLS